MCEKCNKECYQTAFINEIYNIETGLCLENEDCSKKITIDDKPYCLCENNPDRKKDKLIRKKR